jgi:hypothetical protein
MASRPQVTKVESKQKLDTVQGAGWAKSVIDSEKPAKCSSTWAALALVSTIS